MSMSMDMIIWWCWANRCFTTLWFQWSCYWGINLYGNITKRMKLLKCSTNTEHWSEWFHGKFWRILKKLVWTNHSKAPKLERPNLAWGVIKFSKRVTSLTSARAMQSNLASALFTFGSSEVKKTGNGKKIRVQPNRKRKCGSGSQAVSKGRPVQLQEPTSKGKWSHDLAKAVQTNTISNKKSGSHAMKPKTKQIQWKKRKTRNLSE